MCGRYTLTRRPDAVLDALGIDPTSTEFKPRYNISPGQDIAVVANRERRCTEHFRWGLVPSWAKDAKIGYRMINARAETVAEKPSFRAAFKRRRCLVLADGFFEWRKEGKTKTPIYMRLADDAPFAFAGLWEAWEHGDAPLTSCTILTTTPNEVVAMVHDRMPVIVPPSAYELWLHPDAVDADELRELLLPYPAQAMTAAAVSSLVNKPTIDAPACIEPA